MRIIFSCLQEDAQINLNIFLFFSLEWPIRME